MVAEVADVRTLVNRSVADHNELPLERHAEFIKALFKRHRRSLLWYLRKLIPSPEDAEEAAQEAFLRLLGAPQLETDADRARSYLFRTATNLAHDNYRRKTARFEPAHVPFDSLPLEADDPPLDRIVDAERGARIVNGALGDLLPRQRKAFLLHVIEDMTYERIAVEVGVSKKTVERDIVLTLALCRSRLARWRGD